MRIAGRKEDGKAGALQLNKNGGLETNVNGVDIALPTDLQYHALADDNPIPVVNHTDVIAAFELAKNVEIRDLDSGNKWMLDTRGFRRINAIWIRNNHNEALSFYIYFSRSEYYSANNMYRVNQDTTDSVESNKTIRIDETDTPSLKSPSSFIFINIRASSSSIPTEGDLTIHIEGEVR